MIENIFSPSWKNLFFLVFSCYHFRAKEIFVSRKQKDIDEQLMLELIADGLPKSDIAEALDISVATLNSRIEKLKKAESALLAYDKNHYLDLIAVKQKLVEGVTQTKIDEAPLGQIAQAYGVFTKAENLIQGRPTEIHGLMGYLIALENEDRKKLDTDKEIIDVDSESEGENSLEQLSLF